MNKTKQILLLVFAWHRQTHHLSFLQGGVVLCWLADISCKAGVNNVNPTRSRRL